MAHRYTLKTFYGPELIERFDHRDKNKLRSILSHDRYLHAGETGPFGEIVKHPDILEIFDPQMAKIFHGNIIEVMAFLRKLK